MDPVRQLELRSTPGTREYDEDQDMWLALNAARHQVLAHLGRSPRIAVAPQDYCATA